jgi:predicted RNase H-like HicB family nuclease
MKPTDYPVFLVYSKEDGAWLARVDMLPGCVADGSTQEEALINVREAVNAWIDVSKELGRQIPKPLDIQEFEDLQLRAMEHQGQQIQQLIQQAVNQAVQQLQAVMQPIQISQGSRMGGRSAQLPLPQVSSFTAH